MSMAMTDGEIKDRLRKLLATADQRKARRKSWRRHLGTSLGGLLGAIIGVALAITLSLEDSEGSWAMMLGAGAGFYLARRQRAKSDQRTIEKMAGEFRRIFSKKTGDFDPAVTLLRHAKTDSKVEADILKALNMHVQFIDDATTSAAAQHKDPLEPFIEQLFANKGGFVGMPKPGTIISKSDFDEFLKKHPNASGSYSETAMNGKGGAFKVSTMSSSSSSSFGKAGLKPAAPADELLGDLEKADAGAPAAKPAESRPTPASPASEPSEQFIPLDPYDHPSDAADATANPPEPDDGSRR
jgi:hypothetical protein